MHCRTNVCGAIPTKKIATPSPLSFEWDFEDPVVMEPGPEHQEYHDRAMVYAAEADYARAGGGTRNCVIICGFIPVYARDI